MNHGATTPSFRWDGILLVVGLWILGGLVGLFWLGWRLKSPTGWLLVVAAGPLWILALALLGLLGEGVLGLLHRFPPVHRLLSWLDRATTGQRFSLLRIVVALVPALLFFGLTVLAWLFVNGHAGGK